MVANNREPRYDEDGTVLSDGDFGLVSSLEDSSEDSTSSLHIDSGAFEDEAHEP